MLDIATNYVVTRPSGSVRLKISDLLEATPPTVGPDNLVLFIMVLRNNNSRFPSLWGLLRCMYLPNINIWIIICFGCLFGNLPLPRGQPPIIGFGKRQSSGRITAAFLCSPRLGQFSAIIRRRVRTINRSTSSAMYIRYMQVSGCLYSACWSVWLKFHIS